MNLRLEISVFGLGKTARRPQLTRTSASDLEGSQAKSTNLAAGGAIEYQSGMAGVDANSWLAVATGALDWVFGALLIIACAAIGLLLLKRFVAEAHYQALTVLIAIVGAVFAVSQTRRTAAEAEVAPARELGFIIGLTQSASQLLTIYAAPDHHGQSNGSFVLPADTIVPRSDALTQITIAADQIDLSKLPSKASMLTAVSLRTHLHEALVRLASGKGSSVDMSASMYDVLGDLEAFDKQRTNLYPSHIVGGMALTSETEAY